MKKTIIVLDNYTMKVHVYQNAIDDMPGWSNNIDDFLVSKNHKPSQCNWMVVDKLELIIETE